MTDQQLYDYAVEILEAWGERAETYLGFVYDQDKYDPRFLESVRRQAYIDFARDTLEITKDIE